MHQADSILARFPGPVTLYVSRRRKLLALAFCVGFPAFFAWIGEPRTIGYWVVIAVCGALAIRAVILLLFPDAASLTLDADGFRIGHVFHRIREPWRDVGDFRVVTKYRRGPSKQIEYEDLATGARRGTKVSRVLPEVYGRPRLRREELAWLMNEWRRRALTQAERPPGSDMRKSALPHLRR